MHYSTIAAILLAATVAANPIASPALDEPAQPRGLTVTKEGVSPISDADLQQRGLTVTNKGLTPITDSDLATRAAALEASGIEKRDGIHRCGPRSGWTPIETHGDKIGFLDAITAYCNEVDGLKVPKGYKNAAQVDGITLTSGKKGSLTGKSISKLDIFFLFNRETRISSRFLRSS